MLVISPAPEETIEHIMRQLRHGEQRNEIHLQTRPVPICAEHPVFFVPDAAMPENFLDIRKRPKRGEKNDPVMRNRAIKSVRRFAPRTCVKINQSEIRNAVNYHV